MPRAPGEMQADYQFWGVVVKPGEAVKCDPGESYYLLSQIVLEAGKAKENVEVFVNIDDKRILLATLSVDSGPHFATDLVFEKKFELLHSSVTSKICFTGYKFKYGSKPSAKGGDESDEEVPLLVPLDFNKDGCKNSEATHGANKLTVPRPADAPSSVPKATVEEPTSPGKPKGDDKTDAHKSSDGDGSESSEYVGYPRKATKGNNNPVETPLKTPQAKKAKIATPTSSNKTGYVHVATPHPAKQAHKTSGYVHVATPHQAKRTKKATENKDRSAQSTPHICGSCSRTFSSPMSLKDHSKSKHGVAE